MKDHSNIMGYGGSTGNGCNAVIGVGHLTPILFGGHMHNPNTSPRTRGLIKAAAHTAREVNQSHSGQRITPQEAQIMLSILTKHDAGTLAPEIPFAERERVSRMFDKLRFHLGIMTES
jgi:hypothetical protein